MAAGVTLADAAEARFPGLTGRELEIIGRAALDDPPLLDSADLALRAGLADVLVPARRSADPAQPDAMIRQLARRSGLAGLPTVRAELLAWLVASPETEKLLRARWLEVTDCRIEGTLRLDLDNAHVALGIRRAWITAGLVLRHANLRDVVLDHVRVDPIPKALSAAAAILPTGERARVALSIEAATVRGSLGIRDSLLLGQVHAPGLRVVGGNCDVLTSAMRGSVDLRDSRIDGYLFLGGTSVRPSGRSLARSGGAGRALALDGAELKGGLFTRITEGPMAGRRTVLHGPVSMIHAGIDGPAQLEAVDLLPARAPSGAEPAVAVLLQGFGSRFGKDLLIDRSTCQGSIELAGISCRNLLIRSVGFADRPGTVVDLTEAEVSGRLIWTPAAAVKPAGPVPALNLSGASAVTFVDTVASWPGQDGLLVDGFRYDRIETEQGADRADWLRRQPGFVPGNYDQLARVLRARGEANEAKRILIEKERDRLRRGDLKGRPLLASAHRLWGRATSFGHQPLHSLQWIAALILLSALLFALAHRHGIVVPKDRARLIGDFNPLAQAIELAIPVVKLGHAEQWMVDPKAPPVALSLPQLGVELRWGQLLRWYTWLATIAAWILGGFLLAGLGGLVRKD